MVSIKNKLMKRFFLATGLIALLATSGLHAQDSRGRLGIILGGDNGITYDYALGSHFEVGTKATLRLGMGYDGSTKSMQFDGLIPTLEVAPRYYFSRRDVGEVFHRGLYLSLRLSAEVDQWTLFPSRAIRESARKYLYALIMAPTIGWSLPVGETSAFRFGAGIGFYRQKYREAGVSEWRSNTSQAEIPIYLELTYTHAL